MRLRTWLNFWLILPLPVLFVIPFLFHETNLIPEGVSAGSLITSILFLGFEHCLAFGILIIMPHTTKLSDNALMRLSWILPFFFTLFIIAALRFFAGGSFVNSLSPIFRIGLICLAISYSFIIPLNLITLRLLKTGLLKKR